MLKSSKFAHEIFAKDLARISDRSRKRNFVARFCAVLRGSNGWRATFRGELLTDRLPGANWSDRGYLPDSKRLCCTYQWPVI